ncbi:sugar phosphate isomerase/epimerase [Flavihumibacter sp. R14]|nr:sugar phosphate isomerase/epimerase [Flavihumibacter soli]
MKCINRRTFVHQTALLLAGSLASYASDTRFKKSPLSFSTLGCPDWSFGKITDFAVQYAYQGIELRGLMRQMDLTKCSEFNSTQNRQTTRRQVADKGLHIVGLGSSSTLHFAEPGERRKNLDEGKRFIDLAEDLNCPYVRVFPNNFPKEQERNQTMDLITEGLLELAAHARGSKVTVLMETHGDLVKSDDILKIMMQAQHKHTGLLWDISNMWTITKEPPSEVYNKLKKYIRHTHIKDAQMIDDKLQYCLLGEGDVPVFDAIGELQKDNYTGYYSFEWEKLWHPEIAEPEIALAHYPKAMSKYFNHK